MQLSLLTRPGQIGERLAAWTALWSESDIAAPTARAEHVLVWLRHFAPRSSWRCLLVEQDGDFLAALPLVGTRIKGLLPAGGPVANCWSAAGQLLVHSEAGDDALDLLATGIGQLPWPLVCLEGINPAVESWQRLLAACDRANLPHAFRRNCEVGLIEIDHDWPAYEASLPRNHLRNMRKARRQLQERGVVTSHHHRVEDTSQAEHLLRRAIDIETRSWKAASSFSSHSTARAFFLEQARLLAEWNAVEFHFLALNGVPIAFEYGYRAKGIHFAHKTGYDDAYAAYSPGQLLMQDLLQHLHGDFEIDLVDLLGPMSDAHRRWTARSYEEGRLLIGSPSVLGRAAWCLQQAFSRPRDRASAALQHTTAMAPAMRAAPPTTVSSIS